MWGSTASSHEAQLPSHMRLWAFWREKPWLRWMCTPGHSRGPGTCFGAVCEGENEWLATPPCCTPSPWFTLGRIFLFLLLIHGLCPVTQTCPILCNPMDCSPPGYSVHGILPARILECIAIFLLQGIFLTQESNPHRLHWQAYSLPLSHQGSPESVVLIG